MEIIDCRIRGKKLNYVAYADDIILLVSLWGGLLQLMNVLFCGVLDKDLFINYKKTKCMVLPSKCKSHAL